MVQRLGETGQHQFKAPDTFYEYGLRRIALGDRGFDIAEGHVRTAAIAMADQVFTESFGLCRPPANERQALMAIDNIHLWLEYRAMGEDPAVADKGLHQEGVSAAQREATKAARMSSADQRKWVSHERSHLRENWCNPDERP